MPQTHNPWWRGKRGEWYEVLQFALILLLVVGPSTLPGYSKWPDFTRLWRISGASLMVGGVVLGVVALKHLRSSLTALGGLKPQGTLVTSGPYRFVRHPVYVAQILLGLGWSLAFGGWLTSLYALALGVLLNFKSVYEERRLLQRFPEYQEYQSRTWKFIPFIY
jgi:protein-S-isoprenylcysteine O-methyltransferase Ste14